jgi:hypothetical protein
MERVTGFAVWRYRRGYSDLARQMPPGGRALSRWRAEHGERDPALYCLLWCYSHTHRDRREAGND